MVFGYLDESGAPGVASCKNDYFLVSLVVFESEEKKNKALFKINNLLKRLRLPEDYEFHCSSNSPKIQSEFLKVLADIDFNFITVAICKNDFKKTASYLRISELLAGEVYRRFSEIIIKMDSNPLLHAELRKRFREYGLRSVRIREVNSRSDYLVQMADYVANISAKRVKNIPKAGEWYAKIAKKMIAFLEVAD